MKLLTALLCLALPAILHAQAPLSLHGDATLTASDLGAVAGGGYDRDGNLYTVINLRNGTIELDASTSESFYGDPYDVAMIIVKYAPSGQVVWHRKIAPQVPGHTIMAESALADEDGNLYALGGFKGAIEFGPGHSHVAQDLGGGPAMGVVAFITKFNRDGDVVYSRSLQGGLSTAQRGRLGTDGSLAVAGLANLAVDLDPDPNSQFVITTYGALAGYLLVLDPNGNFKWGHGYDAQIGMGCYGAAIDSAGNVYVGGFSTGDMDFVSEPGVPQMILKGIVDSWVCKYDPAGNRLWTVHWGQSGVNRNGVWDLAVDANDDLIVCGQFNGDIDFDPGAGQTILSTTPGYPKGFVAKLSPAADLHWVIEGHDEVAWTVTIDGTDAYVAIGPTVMDAERLYKLDAAGNNEWDVYYPNSWSTGLPDYDGAARAVAIGPGSRVAVLGSRRRSVNNTNYWDGFIRQLNQPLTHLPLGITPAVISDAWLDDPVTHILTATGGSEIGYTWQHSGGALPPGITTSWAPGRELELTGTPTVEGTFHFRITVTDDLNNSHEALFSWTITRKPPPPLDDGGGSDSGAGCAGTPDAPAPFWLILLIAAFAGTRTLARRNP
jgi:hypothetical protein